MTARMRRPSGASFLSCQLPGSGYDLARSGGLVLPWLMRRSCVPGNWELATCLACDLRLATQLGRSAYGRCGSPPLPSDGARRRGRTWFVFGRGTKAGSRTMIWESPSPSTHSSPHSSLLSLWRPLYSSARRSAGGSTRSATQLSPPRGSANGARSDLCRHGHLRSRGPSGPLRSSKSGENSSTSVEATGHLSVRALASTLSELSRC